MIYILIQHLVNCLKLYYFIFLEISVWSSGDTVVLFGSALVNIKFSSHRLII